MKRQSYVVAAMVAAGFGVATIATLFSQSPAIADRPGYRPSTSTPSYNGGGSTPSTDGRVAVLVGDAEERIYVYPSPSSEVDPIGYGFNGDAVEVFDAVSGWSYVQFERSGARGWVETSFIGPA